MSNPPLKLYGESAADIDVISTYVQDSVLQLADMTYLKAERRFVMLVNRYCWEYETAPMRVRCALQISDVGSIQQKNLNPTRRDGVVSILAVRFEQTDAPSGQMTVILSGGGEIRLAVEACHVILEDITAPWAAQSRPEHVIEE